MSKGNGATIDMVDERPTFNISGVSRRWLKQFGKTVTDATRAQLALDRPMPPDADAEAIQAWFDKKDAALDKLDTLSDAQAAMIAEILVDVPRSWLEADAPKNLDWSDPASCDYILMAKYAEMVRGVQTGEIFAADSKN